MCCFRIGTSLGVKKFRATPTKQDLGASWGFSSKFPTSTPSFLYRSPLRGQKDYWLTRLWCQVDAECRHHVLIRIFIKLSHQKIIILHSQRKLLHICETKCRTKWILIFDKHFQVELTFILTGFWMPWETTMEYDPWKDWIKHSKPLTCAVIQFTKEYKHLEGVVLVWDALPSHPGLEEWWYSQLNFNFNFTLFSTSFLFTIMLA